jgi:hypothetical protein
VLIDELGRATSTADGVALSWAMAEYLLALGSHVLLATHFRWVWICTVVNGYLLALGSSKLLLPQEPSGRAWYTIPTSCLAEVLWMSNICRGTD